MADNAACRSCPLWTVTSQTAPGRQALHNEHQVSGRRRHGTDLARDEVEDQRLRDQSLTNVAHRVFDHARLKDGGAGLDAPPVHLPDPVVNVLGRAYVDALVIVDRPRVQRSHLDASPERYASIGRAESREATGRALDNDVAPLPDQGDGTAERSQVLGGAALAIQHVQVSDGPSCLPGPHDLRRDLLGPAGQSG